MLAKQMELMWKATSPASRCAQQVSKSVRRTDRLRFRTALFLRLRNRVVSIHLVGPQNLAVDALRRNEIQYFLNAVPGGHPWSKPIERTVRPLARNLSRLFLPGSCHNPHGPWVFERSNPV